MIEAIEFIQIPPARAGLERLDFREAAGDWPRLRDLVQSDLGALDAGVFAALPTARVHTGWNRDGAGCFFAYRVYDPPPSSPIDALVVGVSVKPVLADTFRVAGDIAGEALGDVLFEVPPREVMGWVAMTEAVRDTAEALAQQPHIVQAALQDASRFE